MLTYMFIWLYSCVHSDVHLCAWGNAHASVTVYKLCVCVCVCVCLGTPVHECVCVLAHARAFMEVTMDVCGIDLHISKCVGIGVCGCVLLCVIICVQNCTYIYANVCVQEHPRVSICV